MKTLLTTQLTCNQRMGFTDFEDISRSFNVFALRCDDWKERDLRSLWNVCAVVDASRKMKRKCRAGKITQACIYYRSK